MKKSTLSRKLTALLLAFLFIIAPLAPIFAAENNSATSESVSSSTDNAAGNSASAETATDPKTVSSSKDTADNTVDLAALQKDGVDSQKTKDKTNNGKNGTGTISASSLSGGTEGDSSKTQDKAHLPQSEALTGALTYEYPINVSPGRNGLQPDLKLTYNSQAGDEGSYTGYGWSVSIPYIERINRKGTDKLYTENYFYSSLSGELVSLGGSSYGSKVDNGEFLKYDFSSNSWLVTDKQGTKYKFGYSTSTRQDNPNDSTKVFKWMLEETRDTNDNYIKYEYYKDQNQIYPSRIVYTGSGTTDGIFEVNFLRQTKTSSTSYKTGFSVATGYRINEINTEINNVWAKKYTLAYTTGDNGSRSLLNSITESGQDESNNTTTLPAASFSYKTRGSNWTYNSSWQIPRSLVSTYQIYGGIGENSEVADVNGDGLPDFLYTMSNTSSFVSEVYLNDGTNWIYNSSWQIPTDLDGNVQIADINGDGLVDIVDSSTNNDYPTGVVYFNNGSGWVEDASWQIPYLFSDGGQIVDVNADGLPDLLYAMNDSSQTRKVYLNDGTNWVYNSSWQISTSFSLKDTYTRIADINGDGLPDLLSAHDTYSGLESKVYLNDGTTWVYNSSWQLPASFEQLSQLVDVNGDGLNDVIYSWPGSAGMVYFNTGSGWTGSSSWQLPYEFQSGSRVADVNGDNLPDLVYGLNDSTPTRKVYLNNGNGTVDIVNQINYPQGGSTATTYKPTAQYKNGSTLLNPSLPFVMNTVQQITNSDGLGLSSTTTYSYEGGKYYFASSFDRKFSGFAKVTETDAAGNYTKTYFHQGDATNSSQGEFSDNVSKIGKVYRVESYDASGNLYSKSINKWEGTDPNFPSSADLLGYWKFNEGTGTAASDSSSQANNGTLVNMDNADWVAGKEGTALDFDGVNDYVNVPHSSSLNTPYYLTVAAWVNPSVNDGIYYIASKKNSWHFSVSNYSTATGRLKISLYHNTGYYETISYSSIPTSTWTFVAFTYSSDDLNRKPKLYINGTEVPYVSRTALPSDYTLDTNTNNVTIGRDTNGWFPFNGKIDDARIYNRVLTRGEITELYNNPGVLSGSTSARNFVKLTQKIDSSYDGNATHKDKAETYTYDNTNGNLIEKVQWGEVTGTDSGTFTDTGTDKLDTTISYASNLTTNVIGLASQETTLDQNSNKVKESKYYYDTLSLESVDKGNLTKEEKWKSGTDYINTQKSYNSYGLVTQDTDPRGKNTTYTYDSYYLYPATVTNALSQATQYTYDYSLGKPKQVTDPNTYVFQTVYDGLDRVLEEKQPDLTTPATLVTKTAYVYTDTANAVSVKKTDYLDATTSVDTYSYFDGLGRLIQTRKEAETSNNFSVKDFVYNNRGLLNKESLPYNSTGTAKSTATTDNTLYSTYSYDPLARITSTVNAVGTVSNAYDDWKVTTTDARSNAKDLYKDAYDRLIQVDEHNGASTYTTTYNYDGAGDLTKITDASSNIRNFTYDGLGRRLTAEDLHASTDATFGTWTYTYDASSNLTSTLDPKSQTVNYTYDDINRQLTEDYTGQVGTEVTYTYDSGTGGIGHLTGITTGTLTQTNTYNPLSLLKSESKVINSTTYLTNYDYDRLGNQTLITNPDNSQVKYNYNTAGLLESVQRKESTDGSYINVITNFDYSPLEQPTTISYANGATTTNTYDSTKLYRMTAKVTTIAGSSHAQDLAYTYDANGNVTQIVDASATSTSKTGNYVYDPLNRLTSATITNVAQGQSPYTETYAYDAIGNITSMNGQSYTYSQTGKANPHAVTSIGSTNYTYDDNGNELTKGSSLANTWDYDNRLTQTVSGQTTVTYDYDAGGQRIKYSNGTTTSYYPSKYYNTDGTTQKKHIFANGIEVGVVNGTGAGATVRYIHTDHLTGSNIITNSSNTADETLDYYPFGGIRIDSGSFNEQRKYAGHEYDSDTSLSYMNARYYDSAIGRFVSQDPLVVKNPEKVLQDPQSLNYYAYARNNPLINIDIDGNLSVDVLNYVSTSTQMRIGNWANNAYERSSVARYALDHPVRAGVAIGVASGLIVYGAAEIAPAAATWALTNPQLVINSSVGAVSGVMSKYISNTETGEKSSVTTYALNAIGGGLSYSAGESSYGPGKNATLSFFTSALSDKADHKQVDWGGAALNGFVSGSTTAITNQVPSVRGSIAESYPSAVTSARTQQQLKLETFSFSMGVFADTLKNTSNTNSSGLKEAWNWMRGK